MHNTITACWLDAHECSKEDSLLLCPLWRSYCFPTGTLVYRIPLFPKPTLEIKSWCVQFFFWKWTLGDPRLWSMMSQWCTAWSCSPTPTATDLNRYVSPLVGILHTHMCIVRPMCDSRSGSRSALHPGTAFWFNVSENPVWLEGSEDNTTLHCT